MNSKDTAFLKQALEQGDGVVRLAPCWVPRSFLQPGGRLKLDPRDLYACGSHRGGIDERWFSSVTPADNGPGTAEDEGLSYIVAGSDSHTQKILFRDAIGLLGDDFLGKDVMKKYGGWMLLCKFFDNMGPIPHHLHQTDEYAEKVGRRGKPEAYYFPPQLNYIENNFPYTFFGLEPGTTKADVMNCLKRWDEGDNGILDYSKAYRLKPGTGWDVPPGILHAPGSLVTYEPQRASDVFSMFQSMVEKRYVPRDLLVKDVPQDKQYDYDYLINMLDWESNVDPEFMKHHHLKPLPVKDSEAMKAEGYHESWIVYNSDNFAAKELTVFPGRTVTIKDDAAYGIIATQGKGKFGSHVIESPIMIRYGELTNDEFFISQSAASDGVVVSNSSATENLVILKHFGPGLKNVPSLA